MTNPDINSENSSQSNLDSTFEVQPEQQPVFQGATKLNIGVLKEKSKDEKRVALTPQDVELIASSGYNVFVEKGAGIGANYSDLDYSEVGAKIIEKDEEVLKKSDIICKITPLDNREINLCSSNSTIISAINMSSITRKTLINMQKKNLTALAYEFFSDTSGFNPFLHSIGEIIGTSAIMIASEMLTSTNGGRGIMFGGITGLPPTNIIILGTDIAAEYALRIAMSLGANVKVFDNSLHNLIRFRNIFGQNLYTSPLNYANLRKEFESADVVINSIVRKKNMDFIITDSLVRSMKKGAIIIDLKVDQRSIVETSRVTSFDSPTYVYSDVTHYCVPNLASRVANSSSIVISNLLSNFVLEILHQGSIIPFLQYQSSIKNATYMFKGVVTNRIVAETFDLKFTDLNFIVHVF